MPPPNPFPPSRFTAGPPSSPFLSDDVEIRLAEKVYEKPNWFTGKKTAFGFALMAAGLLAGWAGFDLPQDKIKDLWTWLEANGDSIAQGVGLVVSIVGVIAKTTRHKKEVQAVKEVAKELHVEAVQAKAETAVAEKKLEVVSDVLTPAQVVEVKEKTPTPKIQWSDEPGTRTTGMVRSLPDGSWRNPTPEESANR